MFSVLTPLTLVATPNPKTQAASLPAYRYTNTFDTSAGGSAYARGNDVDTDTEGNVYVTGYFNGTVIFDGSGGSDSRTVTSDTPFVTKFNADGSYAFTKTFDTSAGSGRSMSLATDTEGNVYVTGYFNGTVIFDGSGGSDSRTVTSDTPFVTKFNADGSYAFTKTFDTSAAAAYAYGQSVATDRDGNVYLTGYFRNTVIFDGSGGSDSRTVTSDTPFVTKFNADGSYAFTKTFDTSAAAAYAYGQSVATDRDGNVYLTGYFRNTVIFDGSGGSDSRTSPNDDTFLTKYNADGSYAFTKTFDVSVVGASATSNGVATDPDGNVFIVGIFGGTVVFDGSGGSDSHTSSTNNTFLTKFNADGSYAFTKTFDTSGGGIYVYGYGIAADMQGNVYITGLFQGTVTFNPGDSSSVVAATSDNAYLTKFNADGSYAFTKTFDVSGSGAFADGYGVATDTLGNAYLTGDFGGTVIFDGPGGSDSRTDAGGSGDFYLTSFQVFIPARSPSSSGSSSAASLPGAPDTGYGATADRDLLATVARYGFLSALGLAGLTLASSRLLASARVKTE